MPAKFSDLTVALLGWLATHGLRVILIILGALIINKLGSALIEKLVRKTVVPKNFLSKSAEEKRENTLIGVFSTTLRITAFILAAIMALSEVGLDVGPVIAAAGIAGIALGFGGQYLVRDFITGLLIILENQYRIGDVVCLDGTCGKVEEISLRLTVLRDLDGTVHHIPNGEIKKASNLSKYYSRVNLNVGVSYAANLEKVIETVNRVGRELAEDPEWKEHIIKPPQFLRVDDFADSAVVIKILGETKSLKRWEVTGELRKRLKIAFDREGIEIPFPQRVIRQVKN